jgi:hypothetical protein
MSTARSIRRDCLVAVVTNDADLARFTDERWYRIPDRALGRSLSADAFEESNILALYQTTGIRNGLPSAVELWGEIDEVVRMYRREIFPDSVPAAADGLYHVVRVRGIERLERPIVSHRPRRVTFIRTTSQRLFRAADVNDLVIGSAIEEKLWGELRVLDVERKYLMRVDDLVMEVDFAVFYGDRTLGIVLESGDDGSTPHDDDIRSGEGWTILRFSPYRLETELSTCVGTIMGLVRGGQ